MENEKKWNENKITTAYFANANEKNGNENENWMNFTVKNSMEKLNSRKLMEQQKISK